MRWIAPDEQTLTAGEIAGQLCGQLGVEVTPTKVGQVAKMIGLDYTEGDLLIPGQTFSIKQKRYGVNDLPIIAEKIAAQLRRENGKSNRA